MTRPSRRAAVVAALAAFAAWAPACAQPTSSPSAGPTTATAAAAVAPSPAAPSAVASSSAPSVPLAPAAPPPFVAAAAAASAASASAPPAVAVAAAGSCVPGKQPPPSLSDAQLFGEIKACRKAGPPKRDVLLLKEAQRRLRGRPLRRDDLVEKMGDPTGGDQVGGSPVQLTRGAFTEATADEVLTWVGYDSPWIWQFWWALKGGKVVGSGSYSTPLD